MAEQNYLVHGGQEAEHRDNAREEGVSEQTRPQDHASLATHVHLEECPTNLKDESQTTQSKTPP